MAKNLKEALLEQMDVLQERGLAPGEIPVEQEEEPSYAYFEGEADRRPASGDRDGNGRRSPGRAPRARSRPPAARQREREHSEQRVGRERRPPRMSRESRGEPGPDLVGPLPVPTIRPSAPPRPSFGPPPLNHRPVGAPPRPAPRADLLRRNAERIQREQTERNDIRELLGRFGGGEADDAAVETFFEQLTPEIGALPPLSVVLEALQSAGSADPSEVGNQVRLHYRRARTRVTREPVAVG